MPSDYFVIGMHVIIGMVPHIIIIGAPIAIIELIASQRSFIRAIIAGSVGIIFITMPSFVISHDILHGIGIIAPVMGIIIGIMPFIIGIGFIMPFIIGIMPFIIGTPFAIGIGFIMPFIIGMGFIMPIGIMGIIGMPPIGMLFMGIPIIEPLIGSRIVFISFSSMGRAPWCIELFGVRAFTRRKLSTSVPRREGEGGCRVRFLCPSGRNSGAPAVGCDTARQFIERPLGRAKLQSFKG